MTIRRFGQVIGIDPDQAAEYERLHAAVPPAVLATIEACHLRNYSIFRHGDRLFAYFEYVGDDFESDMATMAADPATREWWAVVGPMQRALPDRIEGEWWHTIPEVFHVD